MDKIMRKQSTMGVDKKKRGVEKYKQLKQSINVLSENLKMKRGGKEEGG